MVPRFPCFPLSLPVATLRSFALPCSIRSALLRSFAPSVRSVRLAPVLSLLAILPTVPSARLCSRCFVVVFSFSLPRYTIIEFPEL